MRTLKEIRKEMVETEDTYHDASEKKEALKKEERDAIRDWLLENAVDSKGTLQIYGLDFSKFDGDINMNGWVVKKSLSQAYHRIGGNLDQYRQTVEGNVRQQYNYVEGDLSQFGQDVKGKLRSELKKYKSGQYIPDNQRLSDKTNH